VCGWGSAFACAPCTFTTTAWTRCEVSGNLAGSPGVFVGNSTANNGGTSRAANRVLVWGAQAEVGFAASSYIVTTGAASARASSFLVASLPSGKNVKSFAITVHWPAVFSGETVPMAFDPVGDGSIGGNRALQFFTSSASTASMSHQVYASGAVQNLGPVGSVSGAAIERWGMFFSSPTLLGYCKNGSCATLAASNFALPATNASASVRVGHLYTTDWVEGVVKDVCISTDFTCGGF
jgi:hypothetical protein